MVRRTGWMFLGMGALTGALAVLSSLAGCRADGTSASGNAGGGGGSNTNGSSVASGSLASTSTSTSSNGSSTSTSTSTSSASSSSSGGGGMDVTIADITTGKVGPGIKVNLKGVVAMTQKFLVSKSGTGSCLWGVFVSTPGLAETAPNTGILVVDYGDPAAIPDGGVTAFCPRLGIDKTGGYLHDDTGPGDILDVSGESSDFLLAQCAMQMGGSTVGEFQIAKVKAITYNGKAASLPAAHVMTDAQMLQLASPTDKAFHDQWGGVKVSLKNVTSVPQDNMGMPSITDQYGHIVLATSNLQVGDKLYYRGYLKAGNFCYNGPVYPPTQVFTDIESFSYLDFCTWSVEPNNKCADLAPPSADAKDCNNNAKACP